MNNTISKICKWTVIILILAFNIHLFYDSFPLHRYDWGYTSDKLEIYILVIHSEALVVLIYIVCIKNNIEPKCNLNQPLGDEK